MTDHELNQKTTDGAVAIQSGRDTIIRTGFQPEDMTAIMEVLAQQLPSFAAIAREIVDARLASFKDEVLKKFADPSQANPEAFSDPDFQYVLTRAQYAYARSGDEITRDTIVDLIAKRSKEDQRTRLSLTLNDAVEKAAILTKNEFAELSLVYLVRYTRRMNLSSPKDFGDYLASHISPLLPDISREHASYQYLQAHSCASIELSSFLLPDQFRENYAGVLASGHPREEFLTDVRADKHGAVSNLLIPCFHNSSHLQLAALSRSDLDVKAAPLGLTEAECGALWQKMLSSVPTGEPLTQRIEALYPGARHLLDVWNSTPLNHLSLTTVGIAVGYANCVRVIGFDADLGIWIK